MLRVLSLNCNRGSCNGERIASIVNKANADVICFQEFNHRVIEYLVPLNLEQDYIFINPPQSQGWSGNVIYSKFPILKTQFIPLQGKSRLTIVVKILFRKGKEIDIVCLHLDPGRENTTIRNIQLNTLLSNFNQGQSSTILIGDFNLSFDEIMPWPPSGWNGHELLPTYTNQNPCVHSKRKFVHPFDRCLYRNLILSDVETVGVDLPGSDHYGLLVEFQNGNDKIQINPEDNYLIYLSGRKLQQLSDPVHFKSNDNLWVVGVNQQWLSCAHGLNI